MKILNESTQKPCCFAAAELERYLQKMGNPDLEIKLIAENDDGTDDSWSIAVGEKGGTITASNPRALLIAVYRYLTLIGCAFLAPGEECEIVPVKGENVGYAASETHVCSLRHRGVCIEGADSAEDICRFIDWLPKAGYNSFFLQFENSDTFMQRFYQHKENPLLKPVDWTVDDSWRAYRVFDLEMQKRGILQHRMGHGWTARALGVQTQGWEVEDKPLPPDVEIKTALVNGKRGFHEGIAVNTNLCMSRPEALDALADLVVKYARENPSADYIHVWLADGTKNFCECDECTHNKEGKLLRPSDKYIDALNRIDEKLTAIGSGARIVFLAYVDLIWAPLVNKLKNPARFVLMFAPIFRSFEASFDEAGEAEVPPFELNKTDIPVDVAENLACLKQWLQVSGAQDAFDYDYYLGGAHWADPTRLGFARLIARDLKFHKAIGLNGISSCQDLRDAFPNAVAGHIMGAVSADTTLDCEKEIAEYFNLCYGVDGQKVLKILSDMSRCYRLNASMKVLPASAEDAAKLTEALTLIPELDKLCQNHTLAQYPAQEKMWQRLRAFVPYVSAQTRGLICRNLGDIPGAQAAMDEWLEIASRYEALDPHANDVWRVNMKREHFPKLPE